MLKISQTAFERSEEFGSTPEFRESIGKGSQQRLLRSHLEDMAYDIESVIEYLDKDIELARRYAMDVKKRIGEALNDYFASEAGFVGRGESEEVTPMSWESSHETPPGSMKEEMERIYENRRKV